MAKTLGIANAAEVAALKIMVGVLLGEVALARTRSIDAANERVETLEAICLRSVGQMNLKIGPELRLSESDFRQAVKEEISGLFGGVNLS